MDCVSRGLLSSWRRSATQDNDANSVRKPGTNDHDTTSHRQGETVGDDDDDDDASTEATPSPCSSPPPMETSSDEGREGTDVLLSAEFRYLAPPVRPFVMTYIHVMQTLLDLGYFSSSVMHPSAMRMSGGLLKPDPRHSTLLLLEIVQGVRAIRQCVAEETQWAVTTTGADDCETVDAQSDYVCLKLACFVIYRLSIELSEVYNSYGIALVLASMLNTHRRQQGQVYTSAFDFQMDYILNAAPAIGKWCASQDLEFLDTFFHCEFGETAYTLETVEFLTEMVRHMPFDTTIECWLHVHRPSEYLKLKLDWHRARREHTSCSSPGKEMNVDNRYMCRALCKMVNVRFKLPFASILQQSRSIVEFLSSLVAVGDDTSNGVIAHVNRDLVIIRSYIQDHLLLDRPGLLSTLRIQTAERDLLVKYFSAGRSQRYSLPINLARLIAKGLLTCDKPENKMHPVAQELVDCVHCINSAAKRDGLKLINPPRVPERLIQ